MVQCQILNYVLSTKSMDIIVNNGITKEYFTEYSNEFEYILDHVNNYKQVPDIETFVSNFTDFEVLDVTESERYLVDTIREEYLYSKCVPVIKKAAELLKSDSNVATQYLQSELSNLTPNYSIQGVDILHNTHRVEVFEDKSVNKDKWFIPTGFEELDDVVCGWQQGEELVVWFARTNQGKSWLLVKTMQHAILMNKNIGYISPEMSADKIGYRFDTINHHFSNTALIRGDVSQLTVDEYKQYCDDLSKLQSKFIVSTPQDFNRQITITKLRSFVKQYKLDMLAIDGITYLTDERFKKGDNKTTTLTNLSEDLIMLSNELQIPIHVVVQSNRGGIKDGENDTPELEDIRDSDGIAHNATKVISLKQKNEELLVSVKKNRDGRNNVTLKYTWDIDVGKFEYVGDKDSLPKDNKIEEVEKPQTNRKKVYAF